MLVAQVDARYRALVELRDLLVKQYSESDFDQRFYYALATRTLGVYKETRESLVPASDEAWRTLSELLNAAHRALINLEIEIGKTTNTA